jgi:hypothetical protein
MLWLGGIVFAVLIVGLATVLWLAANGRWP